MKFPFHGLHTILLLLCVVARTIPHPMLPCLSSSISPSFVRPLSHLKASGRVQCPPRLVYIHLLLLVFLLLLDVLHFLGFYAAACRTLTTPEAHLIAIHHLHNEANQRTTAFQTMLHKMRLDTATRRR
jgi:hypothetical protein